MATRILVHCKSHEMPGPDREKDSRMANIACQKVWHRDFANGPNGDRLATQGGFALYNQRCWLIIDHGPVDSEDYDLLQFKWSPEKQEL